MLDALPPYDADAALRMGSNSRTAEIQEAARQINEAKAQYLRDNLRDGVSNRVKILHTACISAMSDAAFRQLFVTLSFANRECNNIGVGHKRVAMLLDRSERSVKRVAQELEESGWLSEPKRQRRAPAVRSASIPKDTLNAIIFELVAAKPGMVVDVPDLSLLKNQEVQDLSPQGDSSTFLKCQNERLEVPNLSSEPYKNHMVVVEEDARESDQLEVVDFENYNELFNSWGVKPDVREQNRKAKFDKPRRITDPVLAGAVSAQVGLGRSAKLAVAAAKMTVSSMLARSALQTNHRGAPGGIQSYFQKEFLGFIELLEREPGAASAQAPPGPQREPWQAEKDRQRETSKTILGILQKSSESGKS